MENWNRPIIFLENPSESLRNWMLRRSFWGESFWGNGYHDRGYDIFILLSREEGTIAEDLLVERGIDCNLGFGKFEK